MAKAMELLERYLQSVGRRLPAKGRDDTLAELRANLLAEMEGREEQSGRPVSEDEMVEMLRQHGNPSVVASRYQPKQSLIGPEVFPYYWFTMRRVFPWIVLGLIVSQAVGLIYMPPQPHPISTAIWGLFSGLFYFAAWATLLFAAVDLIREHYPQKVKIDTWDPRRLPKVEAAEKSGLPKYPKTDLIFSAVFLVWLLAIPRYPVLLFGPGAGYIHGLSLDLAPVWHTFYWAVVALNALQVLFRALAMYGAVRPWRRWMKVVERLCGIGILFLLLHAREYIVSARVVGDASRVNWESQVNAMNSGIHSALELAMVVSIVKLVWDVWQMTVSGRHGGEVATAGH